MLFSLTVCLAVAVPYIDLFISLFGALTLSALGLAFPAIIDLCTYWYSLKGLRGNLIIAKNCMIIVFAFFGLIVGTSVSLEKIVEQFSKSSGSVLDNTHNITVFNTTLPDILYNSTTV